LITGVRVGAHAGTKKGIQLSINTFVWLRARGFQEEGGETHETRRRRLSSKDADAPARHKHNSHLKIMHN
jgi:hypothetical protein